jgi:hypothetical protein
MCELSATVTSARYIYNREPGSAGQDDLILDEIHFTAVCPNCGERKIVEQQ